MIVESAANMNSRENIIPPLQTTVEGIINTKYSE